MKQKINKIFNFLQIEISEDSWGDKKTTLKKFLPLNWVITIAGALIGVWLGLSLIFGSWFILDKTEKAAVETFGRFSYEVGPGGLHFKIPFITKVRKVETEVRHRWELGFRTDEDQENGYQDIPEEATMLTRGGHIGSVYWIIQYTIQDTYNWLYQVKEPQKVLDRLAQGSMRMVIGQTYLDDLLTTEKIEIQEKNKALLQSYCDALGLEVTINEVKLQDCDLPHPEVRKAYDGVMNAIKKKEQMQKDAEGYANKVIPEAEGKANVLLNEAKAYATKEINGAKAEVSRFTGIYEEYRKDPVTTKEKLWYEALQEVMPNAKKTIMDKNSLINIKNK